MTTVTARPESQGSPRAASAIRTEDLRKTYKSSRGNVEAVRGINLDIPPGEFFGLLGPNGAGKSTTIGMLTTLVAPTAGRAWVADHDVVKGPVAVKRRIGVVTQNNTLDMQLTVQENLEFRSRFFGLSLGAASKRAAQLIDAFGLSDRRKAMANDLSGGQARRLMIARALVHRPDVLFLDEPTAGLDPKQIIETRELIKALAGNHTIILSTHILPEVSQTCQRVVIINKGHVVAIDTPDNLTARLRGSETMYVQVDAAGADAGATLSGVPGVTRVAETDRRDGMVGYEVESESGRDVRRELARIVVTNGWGLIELRPMRMSLEEIFLSLTTDDAAAAAAAPAGGDTADA